MNSFRASGFAGAALLIIGLSVGPSYSQVGTSQLSGKATDAEVGVPWTGSRGIQQTSMGIMEHQRRLEPFRRPRPQKPEFEVERKYLPQNPQSVDQVSWPTVQTLQKPTSILAPQALGISFTGSTLADKGLFPPDCMGDAGPTQYIVDVNNRIRSFVKSTGVADGVLDVDPDVFFSPVLTPLGGSVADNFTTDPRIRYDRHSGRWFVIMIDVPLSSTSALLPNRVMIGVSDAGIVTSGTVWTLFYYRHDSVGTTPNNDSNNFADYPTLGVDPNALYIGDNVFTLAGSYVGTSGFVVRKSSILDSGPIVVTAFRNLTGSTIGPGPFTPQGVDNLDAGATEGYFIGVDNRTFGTLMLRRITNPGGTPSISGNISLTVSSTSNPLKVPHLGNTGGTNGRLDALGDRLFAAMIRNASLWTAHNIGVNNSGTITSANRTGSRWYEIINLTTSPSLRQSGTVYDPSAPNDGNQLSYWIPAIAVSGQGHVAMAFSVAGVNSYVNAAAVGRLSGDALGTMQSLTVYTSSSTAYNPPGDPGGSSGRRWGDYSLTRVDPNDDMTMWTIQEFCNATNSYGERVVQLMAPPPATPSGVSPTEIAPAASTTVTVTGTSASGSGFYDPGSGYANRISASLTGATGSVGTVSVNAITYNTPTSVAFTLNSTGCSGNFFVTITNPDGQSASSASALLNVNPALPIELTSFQGSYQKAGGVLLEWTTVSEVDNLGFEVQRSGVMEGAYVALQDGFVPGHGTTLVPQQYRYLDRAAEQQFPYYRLKQIDMDGSMHFSDPISVMPGAATALRLIPKEFSLDANDPNPFTPTTALRYQLTVACNVKLSVFDLLGREVVVLVDEPKAPGSYEVKFDAGGISSGVYLYRLEAGNPSTGSGPRAESSVFVQTKRLVLLK